MIKFERLGIIMRPREDKLGKFARFNPGVILKDGIVHMLYRATDCAIEDKANYISSLGYAKLDIEGKILYDSCEKVIFPTMPEEIKGCEDPRIVEFEGCYYIFYTAFDGEMARVAVARTNDFKEYEKLGCIDHFTWDKDAFIMPERIDGKIVYIHRVNPNIQIDYFDSMDLLLSRDSWTGYERRVDAQVIMRPRYDWEATKIGGSIPPIKTPEGWIFVYHGVDRNRVYRCGVALLDLHNPGKVIGRIPYPLLQPEKDYEKYGDVPNVVFPQGAYVYNGELYIYYGAADKYIALAKTDMQKLLEELNVNKNM